LQSNSELRDIDYGQFKILIEEGNEFFLVVVGKGDAVEPVRVRMSEIVDSISGKYGEVISHWSGDIEEFEGVEEEFEGLQRLFRQKRK
jgi:hypothetical protein